MNCWLDLFTGTTWQEFRDAGSAISGFNERSRNLAKKVRPGDLLVCYLTGVMRWVGALEVVGPTEDKRAIWKYAEFPVRFQVKPLVALDPEYGVPMADLEGKVSFYSSAKDRGKFKGFVRQSLNQFASFDGELVLKLLNAAASDRTFRPVDAKKLARMPFFKVKMKKGKRRISTLVSIPEPEESPTLQLPGDQSIEQAERPSQHTEMQYHLLKLGHEMGFSVWVARNDRSRTFNKGTLGAMPGVLEELPTQFSEPAQKIVEYIDVLWLKGKTIAAAFEVECTTSVYSGLLRMSDLLALAPNLDMRIYIVAPEDRRRKVEAEVMRPTFKLREKPLFKICRFLPYDLLVEKAQAIEKLGIVGVVKPEFLDKIAQAFSDRPEA